MIMPEIIGDFVIPLKKMDRRQDNTILGDIFEKDDSGTPMHFNSKLRAQSGLKFRIPDHQRYPSWKKKAKQLLVDTVFSNFPMSGFVVSEHCEGGHIYYDFEDGQSRMSILQDYYNDGFAYETNTHQMVKFSQLPRAVKRRFENYKIYIEVMSDYEENSQFEVFERLQYGEPLKDKDLYWNRREYPYVEKAINIISTPLWRGAYMNTAKGISTKERTALPSVTTFLYAITQYNRIKEEFSNNPSRRKSMWKCFRAQATILDTPISEYDNSRINNFLEYLNYIIDEVYRIYPKQIRERVGTWNNFAKQTGMILQEWLETEFDTDEVKIENQNKWIELMVIERKSGDFMFKKGKKTMWNGMDTSHKQNTDDASVAARLERVNAFYTNREEISAEHGIVYCSQNVVQDANVETTDSEE
jgi:hypothetical protein